MEGKVWGREGGGERAARGTRRSFRALQRTLDVTPARPAGRQDPPTCLPGWLACDTLVHCRYNIIFTKYKYLGGMLVRGWTAEVMPEGGREVLWPGASGWLGVVTHWVSRRLRSPVFEQRSPPGSSVTTAQHNLSR